jgi:hypothetical protein
MSAMRDVELPWRMRELARDPRGYPVPWIVLVDRAGKPHFTMNDQDKLDQVITRDLCSICGQKNTRGRWFVGGPLSAFHADGAYYDPPMHHECATYALQVCPYLAIGRYAGRIDGKTLTEPFAVMFDGSVIPDRPPLFVSAMAIGQEITPSRHFIPKRPYRRVEYWRDGELLPAAEAEPIVTAHLAQPLPELQPTRMILPGS